MTDRRRALVLLTILAALLAMVAPGRAHAATKKTTVPRTGWALYATYNAAGPAPRFSDPCFVHYTVAPAPAFNGTWATNVRTGLARVVRTGTQSFASAGLREFGIHFNDKVDGVAKFRPCFGSASDTTVPRPTTPIAPTTTPPCDDACTLVAVLPGTWRWFVNGDVTFDASGGLRQPAAGLSGRWRIEGPVLVLTWSHGYTDKLRLVGRARLEGFGSTNPAATSGQAVWGEKLAAAPTATASSANPAAAAIHVYYLKGEFTCCKSGDETPHPVRVGPLPAGAEAASLSGPYPSVDAAKSWLCGSHQVFRAEAWISNWSRVAGVLVSNLPCTPNA